MTRVVSSRYFGMLNLSAACLAALALSACSEHQTNSSVTKANAATQQQSESDQSPITNQGDTATTAKLRDKVQPGHLRLVDNLDRPQDGYCLDILGSGDFIRFDMPMSAHNCKPGLYADEAVVMEPNGQIHFPVYGACATAAGINDKVLAGAAVMPRACDEQSPFLESQYLQHFEHRPDGRIELQGSGLCLTVGENSESTFDASHRWRALFMEHCEKAPLSLSQWHFVIPEQ